MHQHSIHLDNDMSITIGFDLKILKVPILWMPNNNAVQNTNVLKNEKLFFRKSALHIALLYSRYRKAVYSGLEIIAASVFNSHAGLTPQPTRTKSTPAR